MASWWLLLKCKVTDRVRRPDCAFFKSTLWAALPSLSLEKMPGERSSLLSKNVEVIAKEGSTSTLELDFLSNGTFIGQDPRSQEGRMERGWLSQYWPWGCGTQIWSHAHHATYTLIGPLVQCSTCHLHLDWFETGLHRSVYPSGWNPRHVASTQNSPGVPP